MSAYCGNCQTAFATKGEKRRHKLTCRPAEMTPQQDERPDDADLYGRFTISPEAKARADAEWEASDWQGRLPEGWTYKGEAK